MARGGGMQDVELVELGERQVAAATPPTRRRRRWWIAGAAALTVVGVLGSQLVANAREQAAIARLADVPGVLAPVGQGLPVAWRSDEMDGLWRGVPVGDAVLIPAVADDGSQALVAHDLATGEVRWSTELYGPDPARAAAEEARGSTPPTCTATTDGPEPALVACLVSDGFFPYDSDGTDKVLATASFVRVVDTADGRVVAQWPTPDGGLAVLRDVAVVASYTDEDGAATLDARDLTTGDPRWDVRLPPLPDVHLAEGMTSFPPIVSRLGDHLAYSRPDGRTLLYDVDGSAVPTELDARDVSGSPGGRLFQDRTSGRLVFSEWSTGTGYARSSVLTDLRPGFAITGSPYVDVLDDGSVPGLLTFSSADARKDGGDGSVVLKAVDALSGEPRWTTHVKVPSQSSGAMILRGRVFVISLAGLAAVDGRTGELLWSVDAPKDAAFEPPMTDGRHLLLTVQHPNGGDPGDLVALDPATGDEVWRSPLPTGVDRLYPVGRALLGMADGDADEVVRVG